MAYIKKNVNFLLVLLLLAAIAALVGFTTYYQTTYRNLTGQYNQKVGDLQTLQNQLLQQKENLQNTQSELQLRVADKTKFESLYTELVTEKNKLDKDLSLTRGALASTQAQLAEANQNLLDANEKLQDSLNDLASTKLTLAAITLQRNNYCNQLKNYTSVSC